MGEVIRWRMEDHTIIMERVSSERDTDDESFGVGDGLDETYRDFLFEAHGGERSSALSDGGKNETVLSAD